MASRRWAGGPLLDENGEVVGRRGRNSRGNSRGNHNSHKSSPNSNSTQDDWTYVGHKGCKIQPSNVTQAPSHSLDVNKKHQSSDKQVNEIEHNISSYSTSDESSHKPLARKETIPSLEKCPSLDNLTNARSPNLVTPSGKDKSADNTIIYFLTPTSANSPPFQKEEAIDDNPKDVVIVSSSILEVGAPSPQLTTLGILYTFLSLDMTGKAEFLDTLDERESRELINSLRELPVPIQLNPRVFSKEKETLELNKNFHRLRNIINYRESI
ncbi:hypothetical protein AVEN_248305-1 [Araneus ventricosus]|uniref:Uncharacterized protein n=1 Tax=Araneus ventricosus TaxID=182803 RepID=A0A4Y2KIE0_ARAVE|nr:hypothetical protein AVEN_248305-1 [Araneus ventricosus]